MSATMPVRLVHGREIVELVDRLGGDVDLARLRSEAESFFGPGATWGNCHGDVFDFEGLVSFLASKGKLAVEGGRVRLGAVPPCSGDHHHHSH